MSRSNTEVFRGPKSDRSALSQEACRRLNVMFPVDLNSHPKYIAVSYAWADTDDTINIQVNGFPFTITSSLHSALKALRRKNDAVLLWADALCINRRNEEELLNYSTRFQESPISLKLCAT
ncbi:hypothetical protein F4779DRAFT_23077 [Xylariaceae sp. FL0662B]|nr:hypothetical protein F4779DRAFT_23077 [Xylariaceae sp. FL0662B]